MTDHSSRLADDRIEDIDEPPLYGYRIIINHQTVETRWPWKTDYSERDESKYAALVIPPFLMGSINLWRIKYKKR
jgi:hypothetical protein